MFSDHSYYIAVIAVAGCLVTSFTFADSVRDSCRAQMPPSLAIAAAKKFPSFDLPLVAHNLPEDIEFNIKNGGSGCLGVAAGDFEGNGAQGYALALKRRDGKNSITVIATLRSDRWRFKTISAGDLRTRVYIRTVPAGHYDPSGVAEHSNTGGEIHSLECPNPGLVTGETESTGMVYCLVSGKWKHIVVQD
jgi:hypothetical protein